ncbi:hypothetical protein KVR01_000386 [Diaporthe batatas]|uniref:uncharacterized protein n=1 Tax=Diaporthe batatas TaxID=748121 RepID=UPI001D046234|nr:uncharacterized protein KVR01_000386 [Diaporthe batatas]KAG8169641.1 hypothetical protein KVR01_000386 [Diaporthe batatas]
MTPPKNPPDLDRILKFCAATPRQAPSPPLRRGEVYCLSSFARRAEQWYREESGRQLARRGREAAAVGRRRQPSRAAKGTPLEPGDYVLDQDEVDALLCHSGSETAPSPPQPPPPEGKRRKGPTGDNKTSRRRLPTPPADEDDVDEDEEETDGGPKRARGKTPHRRPRTGQSPEEARLGDFAARLGRAVHAKHREVRARHDRGGGVRHECAAGGRGWGCVDGQYCGHGLVDRCVAWVPRAKAHLRARVRSEMEAFFSSSLPPPLPAGSHDDHDCQQRTTTNNNNNNNNNNSPERLAELKKGRAAALRAETMRRVADAEARLGTAAAAEAEMLESPTLGRWPAGSDGFPREDVGALRVEVAGLAFAVDVCIGETRVLML